ncbi:MAG: BatD protein [Flavobacteriaceae bacterium]|nr:BatD protein [Flavobacteriaceae bacterium]|tara:strand:- start:18399 stop:20165 length:1767 start_codon:yes stop_codon:yes gene_type:complete
MCKAISNNIFFLTLFLCLFANAQVEFNVRVSKKKLALNERLRIDFVMNQNGDEFEPPPFDNFSLVGGPNQSISNSWINGKRTFSKTFTYFLAPKEIGKFSIGSAKIKIDGKTYTTSQINVEVSNSVKTPSKTNSVEYLADENIHLVTEISNDNPFLNQAISVIYKLYFRNPIKISDARETQSPKFRDFWSHTIKIPQLKVETGIYKGESYNEVVWRKTVLYPQKNGKLIIEPLALNLVVEIPTKRRDFFGNPIYKQVSRLVNAGKRIIDVKELPEKGKPDDFSGAVGKFNLDLLVEKKTLKASESFQAKVEVSGKGNLKLFKLPEIKVPSTLELFEPEYKEDVQTNLSGMKGSVQNTYTIVPEYQGKYPIPAIKFVFFDPELELYKTLNSVEYIIDVYGQNKSNEGGNRPLINSGNRLIPKSADFKFIKLKTKFHSIKSTPFWETKYYWILFTFPILVLPLIVLLRRLWLGRRIDESEIRLKRRSKLARKFLTNSKKQIGNKSNFYDALEKALYNYLKAKLKIETSDMQREIIIEHLSKLNVKGTTQELFISLLENCDQARYSPIDQVKMEQDYKSALEVMESLDKEI